MLWYIYRISLLLECFCYNQRQLNLEKNLLDKSIYKNRSNELSVQKVSATAADFTTKQRNLTNRGNNFVTRFIINTFLFYGLFQWFSYDWKVKLWPLVSIFVWYLVGIRFKRQEKLLPFKALLLIITHVPLSFIFSFTGAFGV